MYALVKDGKLLIRHFQTKFSLFVYIDISLIGIRYAATTVNLGCQLENNAQLKS